MQRIAKIAGEMVPLELLEDEMHKALGTADRAFAVTAIPDTKRGERIVVLFLSEANGKLPAVLKHLGERGFPNLWIPDERDCFAVSELPGAETAFLVVPVIVVSRIVTLDTLPSETCVLKTL